MRRLIGLLLIVAAGLKVHELFLHPGRVLLTSTFVVSWASLLIPVRIGGELSLGLAAFVGVFWNQLRWILFAAFASFACYALFLAIAGLDSCGCFGVVPIHPWWTFVIDVTVLVGLLWDTRRTRRSMGAVKSMDKLPFPGHLMLAGIVAVSFGVAVTLAWHVSAQPASSNEGLQVVGDLTILEPADWVGKPLPISDSIDIDVSLGVWGVLLHRHDCPKCQEVMPEYERLASKWQSTGIAFVEVPPHADQREKLAHVACGRLTDDREWFTETPVEIQLEDGIVVNASTGLPSLVEHPFYHKIRPEDSQLQ